MSEFSVVTGTSTFSVEILAACFQNLEHIKIFRGTLTVNYLLGSNVSLSESKAFSFFVVSPSDPDEPNCELDYNNRDLLGRNPIYEWTTHSIRVMLEGDSGD